MSRPVSESGAAPRVWQRMLSGRRLDLMRPAPEDIAIEDLAHGLARVARWNGQTKGHAVFSVAQHSVVVEAIAAELDPTLGPADRLAVLLHDGPEYVIGDLISPFKVVLGETYKAVEHRLLHAIHLRFDLPPASPDLARLLKTADRIAAYLEATQLAGFDRGEATAVFGHPPGLGEVAPQHLVPLSSPEAEAAFLSRFSALQAERGTS